MSRNKPGRNDPCPCGSGLKYKRCCLQSGGRAEVVDAVHDEVQQFLQDQGVETMEEAQAAMERFMAARNERPVDDFQGLSPAQMHHMLHAPFDSPGLVTFTQPLPEEPRAPVITLFASIAEAIGEKGVKPTAKGNLPRQLCRDALQAYSEAGYADEMLHFRQLSGERDFLELHVTRLVAELGGLLRKYKGRFILGRQARDTLKKEGLAGIYPQLFRSYVEQFNWGYRDLYPELHIIQLSWLFTLYLLHCQGDEWRPTAQYEEAFVRAFPMAMDEATESTYWSPEEAVGLCYRTRALERFATFFGLAQMRSTATGKPLILAPAEVRKTPLLESFVQFMAA